MESWVSCADSAALASLFDETAPRLLRVAIHLVGDSLRAEDLVQAAFLALIEQRPRIARGTPAEPWLLRVVKNKATDARRRRGLATKELRVEDLEALRDAGEGVDVAAERRELVGTVAAGIDGLASPYREVLIARLRHGATAAEVAHLLGRSPGQVRVQLHRGLEMLRAKLPEREALALFLLPLGVASNRATSLGAIRESILSAAASAGPTAASATFVATAITMLKAAAGFIIVGLLALAAYTIIGEEAGPTAPGPVLVNDQGGVEDLGERVELASLGQGASRLVVAEPSGSGDRKWLTGQVIDGESEAPIAGALVRCVRRPLPRGTWSDQDLLEEFPELLRQDKDGSISPYDWADWPTQGDVDARRLARPLDPGNEMIAEVRTGSDGGFRMAISAADWERTLLEFSAEGFMPRLRPVLEYAATGDSQVLLTLHRVYTLTGQLVEGRFAQPSGAGLTVRVTATKIPEDEKRNPDEDFDTAGMESLGVWTVTADESGYFELDVIGEELAFSVLTPGWSAGSSVLKTSTGKRVTLYLQRATRLLFVDDESGQPVERVSVLLSNRSGPTAYLSGRFFALGGVIELDSPKYLARECPMDLLAWTSTQVAAPIRIEDFAQPRDVTVRLTKGGLPKLTGRVVERGRAAAGLRVGLSPERLEHWYPERLRRPMAETQTDRDGRFEIAAPPGTYVLRVETPSGEFADSSVSHPAEKPFEIDLAQLGRIEVACLQDGVPPTSGAGIISVGPSGRRAQTLFDEFGIVSMPLLPPGRYEVDAINWEPRQFTVPGTRKTIDLLPGQQVQLSFDLTPSIPGRCRIALRGAVDFSGWRSSTQGKGAWTPPSADGVLDEEFFGDAQYVQLEDSARRRFSFLASGRDAEGKLGEELVQLDRGRCEYRGVLSDEAGEPIPGVWVEAVPEMRPGERRPGAVTVSSLTRGDGSFELQGLERRPCEIHIRQPRSESSWVKRWERWRFQPSRLPELSGAGAPLDIHLPAEPEGVAVKGIVVDATGAPAQVKINAWAHYSPLDSDAGGTFSMVVKGGIFTSGLDGTFEVLLPVGVPCAVRAYPKIKDAQSYVEEEIQVDVNFSETLRITLP